MAGFWDKEAILEEVRKTEHVKLILSACEKNGTKCLHIHEWYKTQSDPSWKPGKANLTIPYTDLAPLEAFKAALDRACEKIFKDVG